MIASCTAWCGRRSGLVPRTKPRTEPRIVFPGSAPGCPCKCTPLAAAICMTTRPPRCSKVRVVMQSLGVAEHQQGQPGAESSHLSMRGHEFGGEGGGNRSGWVAGSAADRRAANRALASERRRDEHFVVTVVCRVVGGWGR
jgi:hypothetical protein